MTGPQHLTAAAKLATADAYDPTSYHPDDVAAGNTPTAAERAADRDAPAVVEYVPEAADPDEEAKP